MGIFRDTVVGAGAPCPDNLGVSRTGQRRAGFLGKTGGGGFLQVNAIEGALGSESGPAAPGPRGPGNPRVPQKNKYKKQTFTELLLCQALQSTS